MTIAERNNKLKHFITCLKCEVSGKIGKECDDSCPTQYDAGNTGEIIENLEAISKILEQQPKVGHWMWDCSIIPSTPVSPEEIDYCGWVCSECKQFPDDNDWDDPAEPPHYRHCPNCGCPMESEEE